MNFLKMKKRKKPFMSPIFMIFLTPGDAIKNDNVSIDFGPFACAFLLISGDSSNLKRSKKGLFLHWFRIAESITRHLF